MVAKKTPWARIVYLVVTWLFLVSVLIQVFLAGLSLFVTSDYWQTHIAVGHSAPGILALLLVIFAFWGRLPRATILLTILLFALVAAQTEVFAAIRSDVPVVAALHPVNALIIFALGVGLARRAWVLVRVGSPTATAQQQIAAEEVSAQRHGGGQGIP